MKSLRRRVCEYLAKRGPSSVSQVTGALGKYVSASSARSAYVSDLKWSRKRWGTERTSLSPDYIRLGRRRCVKQCLRSLYAQGRIVRVSRGVYKLKL